MKEILTRRINEYGNGDISFDCKPDLIMIDGGKGQLSYAYSVVTDKDFQVDMVSLAEKNEEIYKPNESEPYILARSNFGLKLLQNVRDEAHRFAITFHRQKRAKAMVKSELENLKSANAILEAELTEQLDMDFIRTEATERLGMSEPQSYQVVYIDVPKQSYTVQHNVDDVANEASLLTKVTNLWKKD